MFGLSPLAIRAIVIALVLAATYAAGFGTGWKVNGWRLGTKVAELQTALTAAVAQGTVLAKAVDTCNAGVQRAADIGKSVQAAIPGLLEAAKKAHAAGTAQADRLDRLLANPTRPGADCREAWTAIEAERLAGAPR